MLQIESEAGQILLVGQQVPTEHAEKKNPILSFRKLRALGSLGSLSLWREVWRVSNHWLEPPELFLAAKAPFLLMGAPLFGSQAHLECITQSLSIPVTLGKGPLGDN